MKRHVLAVLGIFIFFLGPAFPAFGEWFFDFENGLALPGYNDVKIPGDSGTLFSFSKELKAGSSYFFRVRLGYQWRSRHAISVFAAPLRLRASGKVDREIVFFEEKFPPKVPLTGVYQFNSYRLTYRYDFLKREKLQVGVGLTAKIRDAAIEIEGGGKSSKKTNVGCGPLLNFRAIWQFHPAWGLLLEGDAAAASRGRAEDVLLAVEYRLNSRIALRAGYRILEGGADVQEVYNFSLINFLSVGITYLF